MFSKNDERYFSTLKKLQNFRDLDLSFISGRILGSMCTQPHPIAKEAYQYFIETNLGDPELFPGSQQIEKEVIRFHQRLLHSPKTANGLIVSGGTEGNITAMWIAKQMTQKKEILIPETAHFSFEKIASLMDVKLIPIPVNARYEMEASQVQQKITQKTAAVVSVAGSTELGTIDDIPAISDICKDEQLFLHVDAAFGGFVIPFLHRLGYDVPDFDFILPGVSSVSVDAHKMGYSMIPMGTLLIRDQTWLDSISVPSSCVSGNYQSTLLGTRSGAPVAAAYAVINYLGMDGYANVVKTCMEITHYTVKRIQELGLSLIQPPTMNVIAVKLHHLDKIHELLSKEGWKFNKINRLSACRLVIMPQITRAVIDEFIPVLSKVCKKGGEL